MAAKEKVRLLCGAGLNAYGGVYYEGGSPHSLEQHLQQHGDLYAHAVELFYSGFRIGAHCISNGDQPGELVIDGGVDYRPSGAFQRGSMFTMPSSPILILGVKLRPAISPGDGVPMRRAILRTVRQS